MSYSPFPSHGGVVGASAPFHRPVPSPDWLPPGGPFGQAPGVVSALTSASDSWWFDDETKVPKPAGSSWIVPALVAGAAVLLFWGTLSGGGTRRNKPGKAARRRLARKAR